MLFVSRHVTLTYENERGRSIQLGYGTPFLITAGGGQEEHRNNVYGVPAPGRHGESKTDARLGRRYIGLVGEVRSNVDNEDAREEIHNAFNPTLNGTLTSLNTRTGVRRWIKCIPEELPAIRWNKRLEFDIRLVALDPFWKGRPLTVNIAQTLPCWSYPMSIPQPNSRLDGTMVFGLHFGTLETRFENKGNVASGFTAEIRARTGTVVNPSIRDMETGNQIRINYTMERFDKLTIVNYLHEKRVLLNNETHLPNGRPVMDLLDADATRFFLINVGANRIGYLADENVSNMRVNVQYTPEYTFVGGYDTMQMIRSPYIAENARTAHVIENVETNMLVNRLIPTGRFEW